MRSSRVITTVALLALALPATADAGSLLSGYGGPGQGSQAILGATVIGGASGGSGGGSSPQGESPASGTLRATSPTATPSSPGKSHRAKSTPTHRGRSSVSPRGAYRATSTLSANETASVATPALGISGTELVYIVLAFGALVLTAAITGRLVRRPQ